MKYTQSSKGEAVQWVTSVLEILKIVPWRLRVDLSLGLFSCDCEIRITSWNNSRSNLRKWISFAVPYLYGVPSPPKSKLVTQHPTLPLSTSDFTVNIELCCYQQRTLQLSTSNYWLNIRHYSYQQRTIGSTSDFSWLFVTQHPTAQLSTSHYWLNIRHYSYQQRTLSRQQNKMFDFAKRHVLLR